MSRAKSPRRSLTTPATPDVREAYYQRAVRAHGRQFAHFDWPSVEMVLTLVMAHDAIASQLATQLAASQLSLSAFNVLMILDRTKNRVRCLHELSDLMLVSRANITGVIDTLVKQQRVTRVACAGDRRKCLVRLTPRGVKLLRTILPIHFRTVQQMTSGLNVTDKRRVSGLMRRLRAGVVALGVVMMCLSNVALVHAWMTNTRPPPWLGISAHVQKVVVGRTLPLSPSPKGRENDEPARVDRNGTIVGNTALTLHDVMERAAALSPSVKLAEERITAAHGELGVQRAGMLPHVDARVSQLRQVTNLSATGFSVPPAGQTSLRIGPYNVFDARIALVQQIFNLAAIREWQVGRADLRKAQVEVELAREQARRDAALEYLDLLRAYANLRGRVSDLELAQRFNTLVHDQHTAGVVNGVEVIRAQAQVALADALRADATTRVRAAELTLQREIGMSLATSIQLRDPLERAADAELPLIDAIAAGQAHRVELQVARETLGVASAERRASVAKMLPSIAVAADYGGSGNQANRNLENTYHVGVQASLPIFDGGITAGRITQARSAERQARLLLDDTETRVEIDVRIAHQTLAAARAEVASATRAFTYAQQEMDAVREQFLTGVGDGVAMVAAHNALVVARETYLAALASAHAARVELAYAQGTLATLRW